MYNRHRNAVKNTSLNSKFLSKSRHITRALTRTHLALSCSFCFHFAK